LIGVLGVLAMLLSSVPTAVHAQEPAVSLMLRASYFYDLEVDPLGGPVPVSTAKEGQPKKRLSRGARIAIGVTVPIVVLGAAVGITAAVVSTNYEY
jgi:hypothetical protein